MENDVKVVVSYSVGASAEPIFSDCIDEDLSGLSCSGGTTFDLKLTLFTFDEDTG